MVHLGVRAFTAGAMDGDLAVNAGRPRTLQEALPVVIDGNAVLLTDFPLVQAAG